MKSRKVILSTLDLLVVRALSVDPLDGLAIEDHIAQEAMGVPAIEPGSVFSSLRRLARKGWIKAKWATRADGSLVKAYSLTALGRAQLSFEQRDSTIRCSTATKPGPPQ